MFYVMLLAVVSQWPCGPVTEDADVTVEFERVPVAGMVSQADYQKLGLVDCWEGFLVRLTNHGQYPAAMFSPLTASFGIVDASGAGCGACVMQARSGGRKSPMGGVQFQGVDGAVISFPLTVKSLYCSDNESSLRYTLNGTQYAWLETALSRGPDDAANARAGLQQKTVSPLWPGKSVWGYLLFQLPSPMTGQEMLTCELGKAVTWSLVQKDGLSDDIAKQEKPAGGK
jgi:hypothetical protein